MIVHLDLFQELTRSKDGGVQRRRFARISQQPARDAAVAELHDLLRRRGWKLLGRLDAVGDWWHRRSTGCRDDCGTVTTREGRKFRTCMRLPWQVRYEINSRSLHQRRSTILAEVEISEEQYEALAVPLRRRRTPPRARDRRIQQA